MTITVTDQETKIIFNTPYCGVKMISGVLGYKPAINGENVNLPHADVEKLIARGMVIDHRPASEQPATSRQVEYLVDLGVDLGGKSISKKLASQLIDAVKSGQGVGYLGFKMLDGSN